ncbi:MAG: hydrolase [Phycisphaerae bacterium]|nr:hydrolase [Phycisphaerae bacterium]
MLKPDNTCLILIDIQEKLLRVMHNPEQVVKNCSILIQAAKALGIPIIWCQQAPSALGPTVNELASLLGDFTPIDKTSFSCAGNKNFLDALDALGIQTAVLCGIETHVCVFQTATDLIQKGLYIHVIADATSARTLENKQIGLDRMKSAGAVISSTEMLLFELLGDSKHEKFRELSKLVK